MNPVHVPEDWHDHDLLTFEQLTELIRKPPRTVRDGRRRSIGPRWTKQQGGGRPYFNVAEVRGFVGGTAAFGARTPAHAPPVGEFDE